MTSRWLTSPPPAVGLELAARRVTALSLAGEPGAFRITAHATVELEPGWLTPSLTTRNIGDRAAVTKAVARAIGQLPGRTRQVALVVPDTVGKVSLLRFDKVPERPDELEQLIRWQIRKTTPFPVEEAQVSFGDGAAHADGGREFVVVVARRDIVRDYESVCEQAGLHAGVVDLATFNLVSVASAAQRVDRAREHDDWLLVHVAAEYSSLAIVRDDQVIFYRNRPAEEGHLSDLVHQTAMYYEDRLSGGGFSRVLLVDPDAVGGAGLLGLLQERLDCPAERLDPRRTAALTTRISMSPQGLEELAAPLGVVVREATV